MHDQSLAHENDNLSTLGIIICGVAALFYCYEYLLRIVPGVMEEQLRIGFGGISATSFGALSSYYYLAYTPLQLPVGVLMDRWGPRHLLIGACLCCTLGQWCFTVTSQLEVAALGRFIVGAGSAFAFVGVLALADRWLPSRFFSSVAGTVTTLGMIGAIAGEVGMAYLGASIGWKHVLMMAVWLGLALCLLIMLLVHDAPADRGSQQRREDGLEWGSFFKAWLGLISNARMWLIGVIGALLFLSLSVFAEVWGKSYLMASFHMSNVLASEALSFVFLGWAAGGPLLGYAFDQSTRPVQLIQWCSVMAAIAITALLLFSRLSPWAVELLLFFYGFFSAIEVSVFALAKEGVPATLTGSALAVVNMMVMLGGVVFQPLVGWLLDMNWHGHVAHHLRIYTSNEFRVVLSLLPLTLIVVCYLAPYLTQRRQTAHLNPVS